MNKELKQYIAFERAYINRFINGGTVCIKVFPYLIIPQRSSKNKLFKDFSFFFINMGNLSFFGKLKKINGQLEYVGNKSQREYETFKKSIPEGSYIELYAEECGDLNTLAQLAKVHAMIKELSIHTGYTFSETKMLIKEKAGLCLIREEAGREIFLCASFGDCNKEELSLAIKACIEMGEQTGHPME